jgi:hypothetical protein
VKRVFVTMPMLLPRLSDKAAAQLLDILALLHEGMQHHYGPQAQRWQHRQRRLQPPSLTRASPRLPDDPPF